MKIEITNPCHENWDAMTPNEKGAFCLSCQKNVIDFTKQTIDDIKDYFNAMPITEKVCGRFKENQLQEITFDHFFEQFKGWKLMKKAALVVFFVFGMSLFGQAQNNPHCANSTMKGDVAFVPQDTVKKKPVKDSVRVIEPKDDHMIMGGPRFVPDPPKKEPKKLMGKPAVTRDPQDNK